MEIGLIVLVGNVTAKHKNDTNRIQTANTKNQSLKIRIIGAVFVYPKPYLQTSACDRLTELCSHHQLANTYMQRQTHPFITVDTL